MAAAGLSRASVITHGSWRQAGDRTKVTLFIDQHMPHVPFLGHAHQRRIDDRFTVRVIITAGIAGNLGTLDAVRPGAEIQVVHGDQMRRCEGFSPSRTSGRARLTITLIAYVR